MKHLLPCTLLALTAVSATAQTIYQWNGTTDSNWQTSSNWAASPGQPAFNTSVPGRLNVANGAGSPLIYTAAEGTTTMTSVSSSRGLVISTGAMVITGGTFATQDSAGDIIGNSGAGALTVNGGSYVSNNAITYIGFNPGGVGTLTLSAGNITLTGAGSVVRLGGNDGSNSGTLNIDGGTLSVSAISVLSGAGTKTVNFNGGLVQARQNNGTFFATATGLTANVKAGGAKLDTNGFDVTVSQALSHDAGLGTARDGGLTKSGAGTLTLSGVNTYDGNTVVSAGTVVLANAAQMTFNFKVGGFNSVSGAGILTLNGNFSFDLNGAALGSYTIIDSSILGSTTFGGTFSVLNGTKFGNVWTLAGGNTFDQSTGVLTITTAVPEPGTITLMVLAGVGYLVVFRRRQGVRIA